MSRTHHHGKRQQVRQADRQLSVRAIRRDPPDPKKLSRAFINMALVRAKAEADAAANDLTGSEAAADGDTDDRR